MSNNDTSTSRKTFTGFIWRFLERVGAEAIGFVLSIILARILDPGDYGTVALITVFTSILSVFISSGMGASLIQKKDADDLDFSTLFYFNIVMCLSLYAIMFFVAPLIANFYERPEMTLMIRVSSLTLVVSGVKNIQSAYVSRNMLFKKFFFSTLGGTIAAAVVGIVMALNGFGVWALIVQSLLNHTIDTIILWITVKWRPKKMFSFERLKGLFSYGWKLLISALLDTGYGKLRDLIIGKKYSSEDLAFYNKGSTFPNLIVTNINSSIDSVLFPTMSAAQDEPDKVRSMMRRAIKTSTYLMMPFMMGLAVCADPIIRILLTEKWLPAAFFMRIFCFTYAFYPIATANLNAMKALGRSDYFLKLEIIKKIVGLAAIFSTMWISVEAMAYSLLVTCILSQIINSWPNKKLLNYSYLDQVKDMLPQILLSCAMGAIVYCVGFIPFGAWVETWNAGEWVYSWHVAEILQLLLQVPLGAAIYIGGSKLFHIDSFDYMLDLIKGFFKKRKKEKS